MKASRFAVAAVLSVAALSAHADEFAYKFSAGCSAIMLVKFQQTGNTAYKRAADQYMQRTMYGINHGEISDTSAANILKGVGESFRANPNTPQVQQVYNQCVKTGQELGYFN